MKKYLSILAALALLFACSPESNPDNGGNNNNDGGNAQPTVVISATSVSLDQPELTLAPGETATLKATVLPDDSTDEVEWSSSDETVATVQDGVVSSVAEGSATITAKAGEKTATCIVTVESKMKAVDLGLSVKWANANLGASAPEDYGDYYAWGEVEPYYSSHDHVTLKEGKTGYDWTSYKWCNGDYEKLTKYCPEDKADYWDGEGSPDGKTVLDPEDDVAHVTLEGNWRMPTDEEWTELLEKCTWIWTTQNGVKGRLVTASNGNSIFLPAPGYRDHTNLYADGYIGYYWSSSLDTDDPLGAWYVLFDSDGVSRFNLFYRYFGRSVRPVSE